MRVDVRSWRAGQAAARQRGAGAEGEGIESSLTQTDGQPAHLAAAAAAAACAAGDAVAMATVWSDVIPTRRNRRAHGVT